MAITGINPQAKRPLLIIGIVLLLVGIYFGKTKIYDKRTIDVSSEVKMVGSVAIPDAPEASTNKEVTKLDFPSEKPSVNGGTRITHQIMAWQSQNSWVYANGGARTTKGSLFDKYNLDIEIKKQNDCAQSVADFIKNTNDYKSNPNSTTALMITFMGSGIPAYITSIANSLKELGPDYQPVAFVSSGKSFGEDQLIGPIDVKRNPQKLKGQVCIGVRMDGDNDVAIKYANDNNVKVNPNPKYYDYDALNLMYPSKADFVESALKYNEGTLEKRIIIENGKTTSRDTSVQATMVATWTPADQQALQGRGGVSIISTKEYASMMPNITLVCKKWLIDHNTDAENIIIALAQAGDQIRNFDDVKHFVSKLNVKVYQEKDEKFWYDTYNGIKLNEDTHIGGSMVFNLHDMANIFGLSEDSRNDVYKAVYNTFGTLQSQYYPEDLPTFLDYSKAVDKSVLSRVISNHPELMEGKALTVDYANKTIVNVVASKSEQIQFQTGSATISGSSFATLDKIYTSLLTSEGLKIRLVGHTDNVGNSGSNQILSLDRAKSVREYLIKKGISADRIEVDGRGDSDPIQPNTTEAGKAKNRRVEIILG